MLLKLTTVLLWQLTLFNYLCATKTLLMGLFSFVRDAGRKLFGKKPAVPAGPTVQEQQQADILHRHKLDLLYNLVNSMKLPVYNLGIEADGETVIVTGEAETKSVAEKVVLALGNVDGVSLVDDRLTVLNHEPEALFYTVVKGDSLSKIAKQFYGNPMRYPEIFEANREVVQNPDLIQPGWVLRIPGASA